MEDRLARSLVGRHQILAFVALTFAISWAIWWAMASMSLSIATSGGAVLNVIALSGPSITALILSAVLGGGALRRLLDGLSFSRASARWVVVALLLPLAMIVVAIAISVLAFGAPTPGIAIALVGGAGDRFDQDGNLTDPAVRASLVELIDSLRAWTARIDLRREAA